MLLCLKKATWTLAEQILSSIKSVQDTISPIVWTENFPMPDIKAAIEPSIMAREVTASFGVQSSIYFDKDNNKKIYYHFLHLSSKWRDGGTLK